MLNYNFTKASHIIYTRQQIINRITLLILGIFFSLLFIFNMLRTTEGYVIAEPDQVFTELGNMVYNFFTLELSIGQRNELESTATENEETTNTPIENNSTPISNNPINTSQTTPNAKIGWQAIKISSGDNFYNIAKKLQLNNNEINQIMSLPQVYPYFAKLQRNHDLNIQTNKNSIIAVKYNINDDKTLYINKSGDHYTSEIQDGNYDERLITSSYNINSSLNVLKPGLRDQLSKVFGSEFDIHNIHKADHLAIMYQEDFRNGHPYHTGDIVAAKLTDKGKSYEAIKFEDAHNVGYYSASGVNLQPGFLRAPLHYTYVSSPFNMHRYHPILHIYRPHEGVDLAAPSGTPVKAAGNGRIAFMGRNGGYGNLIRINYGPIYSSRYAHLARFAKGIHIGSYVKEGQVIGYVGMTGLATGPHLHYEFRIHNKPFNPLTVKLPNGAPISHSQHFIFQNYLQRINSEI